MAWIRVARLLVAKGILKFVALFVYPLIDKKFNPLFGVADAVDTGYYNIAVRNSCHNFKLMPAVLYTQTGNELAQRDWTLEKVAGVQRRWRRSVARPGIPAGEYKSFRITWGQPSNDGKKEFYFGWTMDEGSLTMRPTIQFRPF